MDGQTDGVQLNAATKEGYIITELKPTS